MQEKYVLLFLQPWEILDKCETEYIPFHNAIRDVIILIPIKLY